jgi:hypothetical protein
MQKVEGSNPFSRFAGIRSRSGFRPLVCLSRPAVGEQFARRVRFRSGYLASRVDPEGFLDTAPEHALFNAPWSTSGYTIRVTVLADSQGAMFSASRFISKDVQGCGPGGSAAS